MAQDLTGQASWRSETATVVLLVASAGLTYLIAPRWTSLAFVGTVVVVVFGHAARRDPVGFGSVALPGVALAIASGLSPTTTWAGVLGSLAGLFVLAFVLGQNRLWAWWSRVVLRRPLPSPARSFELVMSVPVRSFSDATIGWRGDAADAARAQAQAARDELATLTAPDKDWEALRQGYLVAMTDALGWWFDAPEIGAEWRRLGNPLLELSKRQVELRGREPEWVGIFPTLPRAAIKPRDG